MHDEGIFRTIKKNLCKRIKQDVKSFLEDSAYMNIFSKENALKLIKTEEILAS